MHPRRTRSAPPARARVNFYEFLLGGLDSSTFFGKKCTPADKILATSGLTAYENRITFGDQLRTLRLTYEYATTFHFYSVSLLGFGRRIPNWLSDYKQIIQGVMNCSGVTRGGRTAPGDTIRGEG